MITQGAQILMVMIGVFATAMTAVATWIIRQSISHGTALAMLIEQVNPPGKPSLREILQQVQTDQAVNADRSARESAAQHTGRNR